MEYSIIQIALVFVVTFIAGKSTSFDFLESLYQPIVTGASSVLSLATSTPVFSWVVPISS